jgi:ribosomal 30S subunit maturation factor RimM
MIDHVSFHSKDESNPGVIHPSPDVHQSDEKEQDSYYYDDMTNYEVYRDDEGDDPPDIEQSDD